ncbi:MAG: DUF2948 family protein [Rhizobiaceae bacterium]|nr:DUF2948 family protein [Rhizobiaceae bacterium]
MERLKLIAMDEEDLGVISAHCQDAVGKVSDLEFLPSQKRFILTLNRYVWENSGKRRIPERRRSVLHFNQVEDVKITGIDQKSPQTILSLLAVTFEGKEAPAGSLNLVFSGNATIRLDVECIEVQLSDMDAAWKAKSVPTHNAD